MKGSRLLLSWMLLASVMLALGDAPYVDEMFDALSPHGEHAQTETPTRAPAPANDASRSLRIYQALATIFTAWPVVAIPAVAMTRRYFAPPFRFPASIDPSGIDRPPAHFA